MQEAMPYIPQDPIIVALHVLLWRPRGPKVCRRLWRRVNLTPHGAAECQISTRSLDVTEFHAQIRRAIFPSAACSRCVCRSFKSPRCSYTSGIRVQAPLVVLPAVDNIGVVQRQLDAPVDDIVDRLHAQHERVVLVRHLERHSRQLILPGAAHFRQ